MRIEEQTNALFVHASELARMCETELNRRIVYCTRAVTLIPVLRSALQQVDALAVPNEPKWRQLRIDLLLAKDRFERILSGTDAAQRPCTSHHL